MPLVAERFNPYPGADTSHKHDRQPTKRKTCHLFIELSQMPQHPSTGHPESVRVMVRANPPRNPQYYIRYWYNMCPVQYTPGARNVGIIACIVGMILIIIINNSIFYRITGSFRTRAPGFA